MSAANFAGPLLEPAELLRHIIAFGANIYKYSSMLKSKSRYPAIQKIKNRILLQETGDRNQKNIPKNHLPLRFSP
jgi:hypothetical protein